MMTHKTEKLLISSVDFLYVMRVVVGKRYDGRLGRFIIDEYDTDERRYYRREIFELEDFMRELGDEAQGADLTEFTEAGPLPPAIADTVLTPDILRGHRPAIVSRGDIIVFYVTDLHLDWKYGALIAGGCRITESEFIDCMVNDLTRGLDGMEDDAVILVGGDVSFDSRIVAEFYRRLRYRAGRIRTIAVLGNHELWDVDTYSDDKNRVGSSIRHYMDALLPGTKLLENSLCAYHGAGDIRIMDEQTILDSDPNTIRDFVTRSRLNVFGAIGFAGLNKRMNCHSEMYGDALHSRSEERTLSARTEAIHRKLAESISDTPLIVLTHMPLKDWSKDRHVEGWTYVRGHDHHNTITRGNGWIEYANNQIGYGGRPFPKYFLASGTTDIFRYYSDGIHQISAEDYRLFYNLKGIDMRFRSDYLVTMVKRNGLYLFLLYSCGTHSMMLDGGKKRKVRHDAQELYELMPRYAEIVRGFTEEYSTSIQRLSEAVRAFGGEGTVHGCIVDIDFHNHLYLNPFDGKITAYFAYDMREKYVFPSLESLLRENNPELLPGYERLVSSGNNTDLPSVRVEDTLPIPYEGTEIYRISNIMFKIQQLRENLIIRRWDDLFLEASSHPSRSEIAGLLLDNTGYTIDPKSDDVLESSILSTLKE